MASPAQMRNRRRSRTGLVLTVVVIVAVLFGVLAATNGWFPFGSQPPPPAEERVVRLQGSNTIGATLVPNLARAFLASKGATDVAETSADGLVTVTGTVPGAGATRFEIRAAGTETGFAGLADGSADVGMASRRITTTERDRLGERGDLTAPASEKILALDAISVIVNRSSGLSVLSFDQLRKAFTCQVTDWSQLAPGLPSGPIRILARDDNSGTFEFFRDSVLGGAPLCPGARRFADNDELSRAVAADPAAIGFVPLPSIGGNTALALYDGESKPTAPTPLGVSTESYLLTRRLYLYVPQAPANPLAQEFADAFALSRPGQQLAVEDGFVSPLFPPPAPRAAPCTAAVPGYCAAVAGQDRVPFDVRFESGTDQLDNRALRNLDLLSATMQEPASAGRRLLLVGFADNSGDPRANLVLSRSRAATVMRYLSDRGVTGVEVAGFGDALPVAANDTPPGREQNRRVEVWER